MSLEAFLLRFKPRYLGLGNELNLVESRDAAEFEQTIALWDAALPVVRQHSPQTEVFVTFQYEWLQGRRDGWFGSTNDPATAQWQLLDRFEGADAIGITSYPGLVVDHPSDLEGDYYAQLAEYVDLPVIITESGWSSNADTLPLAGSEAEQVAFVELLAGQVALLDIRALVWTFVFSTQVDEPAFADMGLWTDDGSARPAWAAWIAGAAVASD